ncbi:hypothetical protein ACQ4PT_035383 [Festuca glaucescens]
MSTLAKQIKSSDYKIGKGSALVRTFWSYRLPPPSRRRRKERSSPLPSPPSPDYSFPSRLASCPPPPPRNQGQAMEASGPDAANPGIDGSADPCSSAGRLSVHQIVGGGKAADIILWKCRRATVGLIFGATIAWWLFEKSELSFLTICCDVLLILILVQFLWVKISGLLNKQPRPLPELVLSEEMVNNAAALFRVKVNNMLMIAHDITLGKDFRLFFQVSYHDIVSLC